MFNVGVDGGSVPVRLVVGFSVVAVSLVGAFYCCALRTDSQRSDFRRIVLAGLGLVVFTLLGARLVLYQPIRETNEAWFAWIVSRIQEPPVLVSTSRWLTEMGSHKLAYGLAVLLAIYLFSARRAVWPALLVPGTVFAAHCLQWLAINTAPGVVPDELVIGVAGPFYSGGAVRAMIMTGMLVSSLPLRAPPRSLKPVWIAAIAFGLLEGITRLVLGRHWPLDIAAAIPIGAGILWCYLRTSRLLSTMPDHRVPLSSGPSADPDTMELQATTRS